MIMTDTAFLFFLLPISLIACFLKSGMQKAVLLIISLYFYSVGSREYFFLFMALTIVSTCIAYVIPLLKAGLPRKFMLFTGIIHWIYFFLIVFFFIINTSIFPSEYSMILPGRLSRLRICFFQWAFPSSRSNRYHFSSMYTEAR